MQEPRAKDRERWQRVTCEHALDGDGLAERAVGKGAIESIEEYVVLNIGHARDHPADALGGDAVGVVLALDEDELPVATIPAVEAKHSLGGSAAAREGVENDVIVSSKPVEQVGDHADRLRGVEHSLAEE